MRIAFSKRRRHSDNDNKSHCTWKCFWESISGGAEHRTKIPQKAKIPHAGKRTHIRTNKVVKADTPIGAALAISRIISMAQVLRSASKLTKTRLELILILSKNVKGIIGIRGTSRIE